MDRILIRMPDSLYEFLLALPIIQDYQIQLAVGAQQEKRDAIYQVTFRMDEKFQYFEPCMRVVHDNVPIFDYSGWDEEQRGEFDCFLRFDKEMFERAKRIASRIEMHITMGLDTIAGTGAGPYPILRALQLEQPKEPLDILILGRDNNIESQKFYTYLLEQYPQLVSILDTRDMKEFESDPKSIVEYVNHFHCVIGPVGILTYLGVALRKAVIEFYHTTEEGRLYGYPNQPLYQAIIGPKFLANYLINVWEEMIWPMLQTAPSFITKSQAECIPMEQLPCIADSAEGK